MNTIRKIKRIILYTTLALNLQCMEDEGSTSPIQKRPNTPKTQRIKALEHKVKELEIKYSDLSVNFENFKKDTLLYQRQTTENLTRLAQIAVNNQKNISSFKTWQTEADCILVEDCMRKKEQDSFNAQVLIIHRDFLREIENLKTQQTNTNSATSNDFK